MKVITLCLVLTLMVGCSMLGEKPDSSQPEVTTYLYLSALPNRMLPVAEDLFAIYGQSLFWLDWLDTELINIDAEFSWVIVDENMIPMEAYFWRACHLQVVAGENPGSFIATQTDSSSLAFITEGVTPGVPGIPISSGPAPGISLPLPTEEIFVTVESEAFEYNTLVYEFDLRRAEAWERDRIPSPCN